MRMQHILVKWSSVHGHESLIRQTSLFGQNHLQLPRERVMPKGYWIVPEGASRSCNGVIEFPTY